MTEACIVKAVTFPVDMYGCELDYEEGWAPRIDASNCGAREDSPPSFFF